MPERTAALLAGGCDMGGICIVSRRMPDHGRTLGLSQGGLVNWAGGEISEILAWRRSCKQLTAHSPTPPLTIAHHAHRISPHAARRPRPQRRLPRGPAARHRQGRDHGGRHRRRHRLPGLSGRQARRRSASTSTRRPRSPRWPASCCATTGSPTAASPRCIPPRWPSPTASTSSSARRSATIPSRRTSSPRSTTRASAS